MIQEEFVAAGQANELQLICKFPEDRYRLNNLEVLYLYFFKPIVILRSRPQLKAFVLFY